MRTTKPTLLPLTFLLLAALLASLLNGCVGTSSAFQVIPTNRPTATATFTPTPTRTPGVDATPTARPTVDPLLATFGPTPTSILGATATPNAAALNTTPTRVPNPNAPRIEFFTANPSPVAPGDTVTLFWSARNVNNAVIDRLDDTGARVQTWNVSPDGSLPISTRSSERGQLAFVLSVGEGALRTQQALIIPLQCPVTWFFQPAPDDCPDDTAEPDTLIEQPFERGRMFHSTTRNRVYALYNDGQQPAWFSIENRFDPETDPARAENFPEPPGLFQPVEILGFVWRGSDTVRNRLGLATLPQTLYQGFVQTATVDGSEVLYVSSADATVLRLLPERAGWEIIGAP